MRILISVGITVVVLIVSVVAIGYSLPRRHVVSRMATYRATPEQLYALITGPQSWRPDVIRYELVPDSGGRELMRETTRNGETITYELLERTPNSIKRRIATEDLPYSGSGLIRCRVKARLRRSVLPKMARCTTRCFALFRAL